MPIRSKAEGLTWQGMGLPCLGSQDKDLIHRHEPFRSEGDSNGDYGWSLRISPVLAAGTGKSSLAGKGLMQVHSTCEAPAPLRKTIKGHMNSKMVQGAIYKNLQRKFIQNLQKFIRKL